MGTSALPYGFGISFTIQAKSAIDNCRAGRAAKGATLGKAKENASIFRHRINSPLCSNQAHFHHLEVIGVWKCVLLFIPVFSCIVSSSPKHDRVSYCVSGENPYFRKNVALNITAYFIFVFILGTISNGIYRMQEGLPTQDFFYCNHLFMFDKDTARDLVGFSDPFFEIGLIKLGTFEIYPLMQILVYIVFMTICLGINLLLYALSSKQRKTAQISTQENGQNDVEIDSAMFAIQNE